MPANEFLISDPDDEMQVGLVMTVAAFESAQRAHVASITADVEAIAAIASRVGVEEEFLLARALMVVVRDTGPERKLPNAWDSRLPVFKGDRDDGRYISANQLGVEDPDSVERSKLVKVAVGLGAVVLHEVSVADWGADTQHAGDLAAGLTMGRRPLVLPQRNWLARTLAIGSDAYTDPRSIREAEAMRKDQRVPEPFIITYA